MPRQYRAGLAIIPGDVLPLPFGEAVKKHAAMTGAVGDQHAITAGAASPWPRDALLDDTPAQIGIDKPPLCTRNRLAQAVVVNSLVSGQPHEPSGFKTLNQPP